MRILASRLGVAVLAAALLASIAGAADRPLRLRCDTDGVIHGAATATASRVDTVTVFGGPGTWEGRFQDAGHAPSWHGWTHVDYTLDVENHWHVSDFQAVSGQYSYWCGTYFGDDPGYGNDWNQSVLFVHSAADPAQPSTVRWTAKVRNDTEPGYDYTYLEWNRGGNWLVLNGDGYDGARDFEFDHTWTVESGDYAGADGDEIQLRIRVASDGAWSDEDDLYDSNGACQVDDVTVTVDGELIDSEDFEDQDPGRWQPVPPVGVGDYAQIWTGLQDLDPCVDNHSPQVAFIDDGEVVPGTGGTPCVTWCYGPGGYTVNFTGGLLGPDYTLDNGIESPVISWPANLGGGVLAFDVYQHNDLNNSSVAPIFHVWGVRSTADPVNDPIEEKAWVNDGYVHYGPPSYVRKEFDVTRHLESGCVQVQVQLKAWQMIVWWWVSESTPAPYFDNVAVKAYRLDGPLVSANAPHLPQDAFPASGQLDLDDLAANSVRFDMARNVAPEEHLRNDPGDSIVVTAASRAAGWQVLEPPRLHVRMRANPVFDGVRQLPPGFQQAGAFVEGAVRGDTVFVNGAPLGDRYAFDLPDTGFFYPGDVIHCYVEAEEWSGGEVRTATLPPDTVGYSTFGHHTPFDRRFVVRALPTVFSTTPGDQPEVLMWHDSGDGKAIMRWHFALLQCGYVPGVRLDVYETRSPSSALGNGLGGRATADQLDGYATILYSSGDLATFLLGNGDHAADPSLDLQVLTAWLAAGDRSLLLSGDHVVSGILDAGPAGETFNADHVGADLDGVDVGLMIGDQDAPTVLPLAPNPVFTLDGWQAYGGCPDPRQFDAILPGGEAAARVTEFAGVDGQPGLYPWAAALLNQPPAGSDRVLTLPYDLASIRPAPGIDDPGHFLGWPVRAMVLDQILEFFGHVIYDPVASPPSTRSLTLAGRPNPFNPRTTLTLSLPQAGRTTLTIHDVRGRLVRTLLDRELPAGEHPVDWDGRTDAGRAVASGVYFAAARAGGESTIAKLTLVR